MIFFDGNDGVGIRLLNKLRGLLPGLEVEAALRLDMKLEQDLELPVVWLLATVLHSVWTLRQAGGKVQLYFVRAQLEARINLLRETRFNIIIFRLEEFTSQMFT